MPDDHQTLRVAIYDSHFWAGDRQLELNSHDRRIDCRALHIDDKPSGFDYYLICDEFTVTRFPYFFPRPKRIALLKESPIYSDEFDLELIERQFDLILTHSKRILDASAKSRRVDFSSSWIKWDPDWNDSVVKTQNTSFIGDVTRDRVQGYRFRKTVADYLLSRGDVDCYGRGIRSIEYKTPALAPYRFSVVMENKRDDYYYSEKLIDCFITETVPVYYGCPSIGSIFDAAGIITFETIDELQTILPSLTEQEYRARHKAALTNKALCYEKRLDSFEGYLERVMDAIVRPRKPGRFKGLGTSRFSAGLRFGTERCQQALCR